MKQCKCGSYAFNLYKEDIDQGDLCDVHYWKEKALAQTEQKPVGVVALIDGKKVGFMYDYSVNIDADLYTTPPQRTWVGLADMERHDIMIAHYARTELLAHAIEAKLKEKNT